MHKTFLLSTLFISIVLYTNATVYYVNSVQSNNLGNGLNWANAKKDIQNAINLAVAGDSVWVAAGTYLPTDYPPSTTTSLPTRAKTIFITDGVKIYGGFIGTETSFSQRNIATYITTLSGDFAGNDVITGSGSTLSITGNTENAYHVVLAVAPVSGAIGVVVDGFKIQGGNANTTFNMMFNSISIPSDNGGAIFCYGGNNIVSNDSVFANNTFDKIAGIYLTNSQSIIQNCNVENNRGIGIGCHLCYINNNIIKNNYQGGISGNRNLISFNSITKNGVLLNSINFTGGITGDSNNINHNTIEFNNAKYGGGISSDHNDTITFNVIQNNNAHSAGGGTYCSGNLNVIKNNIIQTNSATGGGSTGGGIYCAYGYNVIENNTIQTNTSTGGAGGGIVSNGGIISKNIILGNIAVGGGGIYSSNCLISDNSIISNSCPLSSSVFGGGVVINSGKLLNNIIALNTGGVGGGVFSYSGSFNDTFINNTFYKNTALTGGGIYGGGTTTRKLYNNIFWRNTSSGSAGFDDFSCNNSTFYSCLVQYPISQYTFTGLGNHDLGILSANIIYTSDPQFVDTTNIPGADGIYGTSDDGLRLKSISPCLNTGFSGANIPLTDIIGTTRPQGTGIDIGAYEKIYCSSVSVPTNITNTSNLNICNGFATTLSVSSSQPADSVFWYVDSLSILSIDTGYSFTTGILNATDTFWVSAHNCDSVSGRLPIIVHVNPVITITTLPNDTICSGAAVTITANGANLYNWSGGVTNGVAFSPTISATYTVTSTDINGCTKTSTQAVTVLSLPIINISVSPNDTICEGSSVNITANGASTYNWSGGISNGINFSPTSTSTYSVTAIDINGCIKTSTQTITVNPLPIINITTSPNDTICMGASISLTATGGSTYSWSGSISNATVFTPTTSATYTVTVTNANNCSNTSTQSVTVNLLPSINITVSPNDTICAGTALTLTANGGSTYSWSGGVTNTSPFTPTVSNTYTVTATASNSCSNTSTQNIVVKPIIVPTISVTPSVTQGVTGDPIIYSATTNVPTPYSIDWYRNLSLANTSVINTWNTTIVAGVNNIYAVIKSPTNCLSPDSAKSTTLSILNVTGVSEFLPQGFSFYPNPTDNQLTIVGLMINDKISLYNSLGQIIFSEINSNSKTKTIQVTSYSTGNYIILFERNNQKWQIQFQKK